MSENIRHEKCTRKVSATKSHKSKCKKDSESTLNAVGGKVRIKVDRRV